MDRRDTLQILHHACRLMFKMFYNSEFRPWVEHAKLNAPFTYWERVITLADTLENMNESR